MSFTTAYAINHLVDLSCQVLIRIYAENHMPDVTPRLLDIFIHVDVRVSQKYRKPSYPRSLSFFLDLHTFFDYNHQ